MSGLGASNLNLNLNLNLASMAGAAGASVGRVRYNTSDYRKLLSASGPVLPPSSVITDPNFKFPKYWDANLRTYPFLAEFVVQAQSWITTSTPTWIDHLKAIVDNTSTGLMPPYKLSTSALESQVLTVLDRAADRDDRFAEIIDQNDADGAINYWLGMLMIDPARHPATYLLIRVAARIGEAVVMCLKAEYRCPRPPQFCPGIVPMIDPPATPSYPAGHALQSWMISKFMMELDARRGAKARIPQPTMLELLAQRIAENRVIAGIHFPIDNLAGVEVAKECLKLIWPSGGTPPGALLQALVTEATAE